jgi:hypothetical protein
MLNNETIITILVSVIAGGILLQLIILLFMFLAVRKGMKVAAEYASDMKSQIVPVLEHSKVLMRTTKDLITRFEPKLEATITDVAEVTRIANVEAKKLQVSADEIADILRRQATRMDSMTTETLNALERAGQLLNQAVTIPIRQISGVVAAAKAIFETMRNPTPRSR